MFGPVRNPITMPTRVKILIFPIADGTANMSGRDHGGVREPTPRRDQRVRNDDLSEDIQGNSELSQPVDETNNVFFVNRRGFHLSSSRRTSSSVYLPKEETFTIPLKYIAVTRTTHTNLDVLQENVLMTVGDRSLSDARTGFTHFTILNEKHPEGNMWSGERLKTIQATTGPDFSWPEIWCGTSKAAQKKAKH